MKKIPKAICVEKGCYKDSLHKRLCRAHYRAHFPDDHLYEYTFRWNVIESFEGTIRAASGKEARALILKGMVAALRTDTNPKPRNVEIVRRKICL